MFHFSNISVFFSYVVDSNKVKNLSSVKEATSVLECIEILQDENIFTPTDVIYMQFLCQETDCFDLFTKCVEYAECKQRALCYFKKTPGKVCWFFFIDLLSNIKMIGISLCASYLSLVYMVVL